MGPTPPIPALPGRELCRKLTPAMKTACFLSLSVLGALIGVACLPAAAADSVQLEQKAAKLVAKFEAMQAKGAKPVPADSLKKAQGIVLLDRTKAGFIFAYEGGAGVAMTRDPKTGKWGPLAFMSANEASLGFQIGGQQSFLVMLIMDKASAAKLTESAFEFGGEARGTAGDQSAGEQGTLKSDERSVLIYDERQGLFGGAAIKGGSIAPNQDANRLYYGDWFSMKDILFDKKVKPTKAALRLAELIEAKPKKQAP